MWRGERNYHPSASQAIPKIYFGWLTNGPNLSFFAARRSGYVGQGRLSQLRGHEEMRIGMRVLFGGLP